MSFIRIGWPRKWAKGDTESYVYSRAGGEITFHGSVQGSMHRADFIAMLCSALRYTSLDDEEIDTVRSDLHDEMLDDDELRDDPLDRETVLEIMHARGEKAAEQCGLMSQDAGENQ